MTRTAYAALTMTPGEWRLRLAQLCQESANAACGQEDAYLRLGHGLLASLPAASHPLSAHLPPLARFEALLAAGAHDSAAMALVPEGGSYMVSRACEGGSMATVMLPGMDEEVTIQAHSPALALISALAAALASRASAWPAMGTNDVTGEMWARPEGVMLH
ncbi:MAG: hypothetical protein KGJ57_05660 [Sphingomonadales bacterium]|nr:hypothetical protein [Sphingomonadales bacterium]MDE2168904.1 hypothetical protein [Sphingomonadales bacterium]